MMLGKNIDGAAPEMNIHDNIDVNSADRQTTNEANPSSPAMVKDGNGRLPLHIGCEIGLEWDNGLKTVLDAHSLAVETADPMTGLYPFMLAAVGEESYDLNVVFGLFV